MSNVTVKNSDDGRQVIISVAGRFDFSVHKDFREAYRGHDKAGIRFVLDLSRTEYMDSSALGMVLLLKEHAGGDKGRVEIRNAKAEVEKILRIANFDKLLELNCA